SNRGTFVSNRGTFVSNRGTFVSNRGTFVPNRGTFISNRGTFVSNRGTFVPNQCWFIPKKVHSRRLWWQKRRSARVPAGSNVRNFETFGLFRNRWKDLDLAAREDAGTPLPSTSKIRAPVAQ